MPVGGRRYFLRLLAPLVLIATASTTTATSTQNDVSMLRRVGEGLPDAGQWRQGFALADADGDGVLDIVHGPPRGSAGLQPRIFHGDGAGGFRDATSPLPALEYVYGDAGVGDLDGDGTADLALAMHLRGVLVLWGEGGGRFRAASDSPEPALVRFASRSLEVADLDGDGVAEVVALAEGPLPGAGRPEGGILLLRWDRSRRPSRQLSPTVAGGGTVAGDALLVADLDGDRLPEVVVAPARVGAPILVWPGPVHEDLRSPRAIPLPDAEAIVTALAVVESGGGTELVAAARGPRGRSIVFSPEAPSGSDATFEVAAVVRSIAGVGASEPGFDLVLLTEEGALLSYRRTGGRRWSASGGVPAPRAGDGCAGSALGTGDLDGDGRLDLVATFASEPGRDCPGGGRIAAWLAEPSPRSTLNQDN